MPPAAPQRSPSAEDNDRDAIFVKDGYPVCFFFHASIRQGLDKLTQEITRHGGEIREDEQQADVILVDEEADIEHIRRRYYRSHLLWQQRVVVEPRKFVHKCIITHKYEHTPPARKGMPGARGGRIRVPFTQEDDENLAYYIATVIPDPADGGRMGNSLYKTLTEELALEPEYTWAKRHTWHSWRERYKVNSAYFDPKIGAYAAQLKNVSHGLGHDPRSHRYKRGRLIRRAQRMEDEEEEEEGGEEEGGEGEESDLELEQREVGSAGPEGLDNRVPGGVPQVHEGGAENIPDHRTVPEQQLRRRRRDDPDTSQREILSGESPLKRQRVADRVAPRPRASLVEKGRRASVHDRPSRNSNENDRMPPEEGNDDTFAQEILDDAVSFGIDQMPELYESPVRSPEYEITEAQPNGRSAARAPFTAKVVQAAQMSSQATLVAQPLRSARGPFSSRGRAEREGSPAVEATTPAAGTESNPQVKSTRKSSRSRSRQPAVAPSDAPYRHTRARSRSVDLPPQSAPPSRGRRVVSAKGKGKPKEKVLEEVPEEDAERHVDTGGNSPARTSKKVVERRSRPVSGPRPQSSHNTRESPQSEGLSADEGETSSGGVQILSHLPDTLQEEDDVKDILEHSLFTDDEDEIPSDKSSNRGHQEFSVNSSSEEPSDSDDAATHRMLQKTRLNAESDKPQENSAQRLTRMASAGFGLRQRSRVPKTPSSASNKPPTIRVTRQRVHARPFPSPGTKARTVYEAKLREKRAK